MEYLGCVKIFTAVYAQFWEGIKMDVPRVYLILIANLYGYCVCTCVDT